MKKRKIKELWSLRKATTMNKEETQELRLISTKFLWKRKSKKAMALKEKPRISQLE